MAALTPPPPAPQRGDRATFSQRVDVFLSWLVALIPQLNIFEANLTKIAYGGAFSLSYNYYDPALTSQVGYEAPGNFTIVDQDKTLIIDLVDNTSNDVGVTILSALASNSGVKGSFKVTKVNDPSVFVIFNVVGTPTNLAPARRAISAPVELVDFSRNKFLSRADNCIIQFQRNGDKGDNAPGALTRDQILSTIDVMPIANGGTGASSAAPARINLGLGNVNNTSDADKPVSTATSTAITNAVGQKLDRAGGNVTGNLVMNNNVGLFGRDTGGTARQLLVVAGDNNTYFTNVGGQRIIFNNLAGAEIASLNNAGEFSAAKVSQTSDETLKTNWQSLTEGQLIALASMQRVGTFDWIDGGARSVGGSAQEIRRIVPEAVTEGQDGKLRVDYGGLNFAVLQAMLRRDVERRA